MTDFKHWKLKTDADAILWCELDKQDVAANVLNAEIMTEFGQIIERAERETPRGLVIRSHKPGGFIAGADVAEFTRIQDREHALTLITRLQTLFNRLEALPCPTLALIHGYCLGGGLELALACRYRVALDEPETRLGLPEVQLGIHPGIGGSLRLPRLIGALPALPWMLTGRRVDARRALQCGLVDRIVPRRQLRNAAAALILRQPAPQRPAWHRRWLRHSLIRPLVGRFLRRELVKRAREEHYPAPYRLLNLWEDHGGDDGAMLRGEAESVADLILTETSRNLVRLFLLRERLRAAGKSQEYHPQRVHVVGAGVMGGDIAAWCAAQGCAVTLQDQAPERVAPAIERAHALFEKRLQARARIISAMDRLIPDPDGYGVAKADVIIEAISENLAAKRGLFKTLEARCRPDALLATNTSSLLLDDIGGEMTRPERLVGMHFFNPVARMELVEIVRAERTAPDSVARAAAFCRRIDRLPLIVKCAPGFLVNRVLTPYLLEAVTLVEEGVPAPAVDAAALRFGMPMGPVELADSVGLDVCLNVAENLSRVLPITVPEVLRQYVSAGRLGRKSGQGYYRYRNGRPVKDTRETAAGGCADLEERLIMRLVNECTASLREGIVAVPDLVDAALVFGAGFAPFRGGPMRYAQREGYADIVERLTALNLRYGARFKPDAGWSTLQTTDVSGG
jgi:3-hydroxyacyl-CoA dehydrogenase/enoyl-CoA hydratase/3-hydroxybutyryl-CoA epimerase